MASYCCLSWFHSHIQLSLYYHYFVICIGILGDLQFSNLNFRTSDTEVLESANITSIEALIIKSELRWCGHIVRIDDNRIPKQLLYGEVNIGKRKACKPKLRFKDRLKNMIKLTNLSVDNWEVDALDRSQWHNKVSEGISTFESNRISNASFKRAIRKGEDVVPNRNNPLVGFKFQTCGKPCLSLAGLKSHKRSHIARRPIVCNI